jgi:hypothetical protein
VSESEDGGDRLTDLALTVLLLVLFVAPVIIRLDWLPWGVVLATGVVIVVPILTALTIHVSRTEQISKRTVILRGFRRRPIRSEVRAPLLVK